MGLGGGVSYAAPIVPELTDQEREALHSALLALRGELEQTLSTSANAEAPVDLDEPIGRLSRMDAMQQQKMDAANRRAAQARKKQVDSALGRFEADEYGDCLDCGEAIDARRLGARPEAPFCIACQSSREQRQ